MIKPMAIVVDLDSTMFDDRHRLHLISHIPDGGGKSDEDFEAYHDRIEKDKVNYSVRAFCNNIAYMQGVKIIVVTARPEQYKERTINQLKKFNCKFDALIMRPKNDLQSSASLKKSIILMLMKHNNIIAALEDRDDVIRVYQKLGIETLKIHMRDK